jgi:hypothetical protein
VTHERCVYLWTVDSSWTRLDGGGVLVFELELLLAQCLKMSLDGIDLVLQFLRGEDRVHRDWLMVRIDSSSSTLNFNLVNSKSICPAYVSWRAQTCVLSQSVSDGVTASSRVKIRRAHCQDSLLQKKVKTTSKKRLLLCKYIQS